MLHSIVKMYLYSQEMAKRYSEEQKHNSGVSMPVMARLSQFEVKDISKDMKLISNSGAKGSENMF